MFRPSTREITTVISTRNYTLPLRVVFYHLLVQSMRLRLQTWLLAALADQVTVLLWVLLSPEVEGVAQVAHQEVQEVQVHQEHQPVGSLL